MGALTQEQYQDPEFFNPDRWVDFTSTEMVLLDPANGNPYKPGEPPEWIIGDERLANGYELLGKVGMQRDLTIVLAGHSSAANLNPSPYNSEQPFQFEHAVASSRLHGWEQVGWNRGYYGGAIASSERLERDMRSKDSFKRRRAAASFQHDTPAFSYDIEGTNLPIDRALCTVIYDRFAHFKGEDPRLDESRIELEDKLALLAGVLFLRDWYIPGKFMSMTEEISEVSDDTNGDLMTIGSLHLAIPERFNDFGLSPHVVNLGAPDLNRTREDFRRLNTSGRLPVDAADALLYYFRAIR